MATFHGTFWRGLGPGVALATLAASPIARADDEGLRFHGPDECPDESQVRAAAAAMIGRRADELGPLDVEAEVARLDEGGYRLAIRTPEGERELVEDTCGPLADAAALIVALMIDPEAVAAAPEPPPDRDHTPPLADPAPRRALRHRARRHRAALLGDPAAEPSVAAPPPGPGVGVGAGVALVVDVGTLPSVTAGAMGEMVLRVEAFDLRLRLAWLAEQGAGLGPSAPPGAGVSLGYVGGSVHGCGRPFADFGLAICGGLHAGAVFGRSQGVSDPAHGEGALAALSAGVAVPWQIVPELDVELGAELVVPIAVPSFAVLPFGDAYQPAPVSGRFTLAVHVDVR